MHTSVPADTVVPLPGGLQLRRMGLQDLPWVVAEHSFHFPDGFFARLGPKYLTRYYRTFLDGPTATALVVEDGTALLGYLVGVFRPQRHRQLVVEHHGFGLALHGLWGMVRHPYLAVTFIRTRLRRYAAALLRALRKHGGRPDGGRWGARERPAVLTHIVVSRAAQGGGIGAALITRFQQEATVAGCTRAILVTAAGPVGAGSYYERRGWRRSEIKTTDDGRALHTYEIDLPGPVLSDGSLSDGSL